MNIIFILIGLSLITPAFSQTITDTTLIQGRLTGSYFIFDIPANPEGKNIELLTPGTFVYIVGEVSTKKNPPQDLWYHCFYKNIEGYLPTSKVEIYGNYSTEKLNYLSANKDNPFKERQTISKGVSFQAGVLADSVEKSEHDKLNALNREYDSNKIKLAELISVRAKHEKILILKYSYPINILGYPDFNVRFINGSEKPIKYVTFKILAYNAVNDPEGTKEVKCIGEIAPFDNKEYHFEDIFFSKVTDHFSIPTVKIQYMDNSIITISGVPLISSYYNYQEKLTDLKDYEVILKQVYYSHTK